MPRCRFGMLVVGRVSCNRIGQLKRRKLLIERVPKPGDRLDDREGLNADARFATVGGP